MSKSKVSSVISRRNLHRKVMICLSKDGVFKFSRRDKSEFRELIKTGYLPCASVANLKEAGELQILTCKLSYDGTTYRYPLDGTLAGLEEAGNNLELIYQQQRQRKAAAK